MLRLLNVKLICKVLGLLLSIEAGFMLLSMMLTFVYHEESIDAFITSILLCFGTACACYLYGRNAGRFISKREGYLIVFFSWVSVSLFGSFPYYLSGYIPSFTDAFFETMSGFSTTGSTILKDIERLPHSLLFWRALTHWLGGMGIIVFTLALLPLFKNGGVQLFMAESTGPTLVKIHPRIAETSQRLWLVYIVITLLECLMLYWGGMSLFDSVCHSFSTAACGGFSTKNASIAYWQSPYIHYIIALFMFVSSVNFTLLYYFYKRKWNYIRENEELKYFVLIILSFSLLIGGNLYYHHYSSDIEQCFRDALFQVVSIISSTGFATCDYMLWPQLLWVMLLFLMISGGSAGSTSGGAKIVRIILMFKYIRNEFNRYIHPNAVIPVKLNNKVVSPQIVTNVLVFLFIFILVIMFSLVVLTATGLPFEEAFGASISAIGNTGPSIGSLGPAYTYADISDFAKWYISFLMVVGRLEIFTVLVIFTPYFWRD